MVCGLMRSVVVSLFGLSFHPPRTSSTRTCIDLKKMPTVDLTYFQTLLLYNFLRENRTGREGNKQTAKMLIILFIFELTLGKERSIAQSHVN